MAAGRLSCRSGGSYGAATASGNALESLPLSTPQANVHARGTTVPSIAAAAHGQYVGAQRDNTLEKRLQAMGRQRKMRERIALPVGVYAELGDDHIGENRLMAAGTI